MQKTNMPAAASMDTELGRMLVEQRLAMPEEVHHCLSLQAKLAEQNNHQPLAEILVAQGVVTERQIQRVTKGVAEDTRAQQIPGYQILGRLGSGAMATVFKARQLSLDRMVAIKVLSKRLSENPEYVERFYREGKAAAKLNHANIVAAYDVGEASGYHYFVMEYVEGRTLYDDLASGKVYSEAEAMKLAMQIARALEHAHGMGFIHRDVKPKNIMLTKDGTAKLADMGLARAVSDKEAALAEAGRAFGTPYYISPEQIRGEIDIDFRADIYSLGATLYHMITGRVPFDAPTPLAVMQKHLKEAVIPPDHINTSLSAGLGEVVETMMAKNRDHRYASTSDLLQDLQAILAGEAPLQARRQLSSAMLATLASEGHGQTDSLEEGQADSEEAPNFKPFIIMLAVAVGASVLLNILLLLAAKW